MTQETRVQEFVAAFEGLRAEVEKVIVENVDLLAEFPKHIEQLWI